MIAGPLKRVRNIKLFKISCLYSYIFIIFGIFYTILNYLAKKTLKN